MAEWVFAVERAYVAAGTRKGAAPAARAGGDAAARARAKAAAAAVASRFLAVGTPRSFALVIDEPAPPEQLAEAVLTLEAHRTWFQPRDIRCTSEALAVAAEGRVVSVDEALAADIVCIHGATAVTAAKLRRGTHVNVLGTAAIEAALYELAVVTDEPKGLPALAAGLVDGRQLDEITIFASGDAPIAMAALTTAG